MGSRKEVYLKEEKEDMIDLEYQSMLPVFQDAEYGSYLIIPLKYDETTVSSAHIGAFQEYPVETNDLMEQTRRMFDKNNPVHAGLRYRISGEELMKELFGDVTGTADAGQNQILYASEKGEKAPNPEHDEIRVEDSFLFLFEMPVAFLCLGVCYRGMDVLHRICNPGYAKSGATYFLGTKEISLDRALIKLFSKMGLEPFFPVKESLFLEAYVYTIAVVKERFRELITIQQGTLNLHLFVTLTNPAEDLSQEDVRYVYAAKEQKNGTYRWGACISSQRISYLIGGHEETIEKEMELHSRGDLPLVILALEQKYTCLRFAELLSKTDRRNTKALKNLKKQMLTFRAYATVDSSNVSRWFNIKRVYEYLSEDLGVKRAIEDISNKLGMLADYQQDLESRRYATISWLITLFGIVSILASVLSIINFLNTGWRLYWIVTIVLSLLIVGTGLVALRFTRK